MSNIKLFISHTQRDEMLAEELVNLVNECLEVPNGAIRCSSVQGYNLKLGALLDATLQAELKSALHVVALLTPNSIASPWVLFELGAVWGLARSPIPLLAGALKAADLPGPLRNVVAGRLDQPGDLARLIKRLHQDLGWPERDPARCITVTNALVRDIKDKKDESVRRQKPEFSYDVFLSMPMTSLEHREKYEKVRLISHEIVAAIQASTDHKRVYFSGSTLPDFDQIYSPTVAVRRDLKALSESRIFVMIIHEALVTSCFVEAGYAIAQKKPSIYFVRNKADIPYMLREGPNVLPQSKILEFDSFEKLVERIKSYGQDLLGNDE